MFWGMSMPSMAHKGFARWLGLAALALLALLVLALRGAALLFDHSLLSIDGAMQTWFAVSHFADGAQLGAAFQSYLGVTMILALLPLYWAFGGTLFASTLAATAAVIAGALCSAYAIAWLIRWVTPGARWMVAVGLVCTFYFIGPLIAEAIGLRYPLSFDPGVSLRPVRAALPFVLLPVFVITLQRIMRTQSASAAMLLGLAAGLGLLWSNDAGIPLVLALIIALGLALWRRPAFLARTLALFAVGTVTSASATIMLVTHGEPGGWLRYNFVDVPGDQFWYFAPWDRASRILSPLDLARIITGGDPITTASLLVLIACLAVAALQLARGRGSPVRLAGFVMVGACTVGTALVPQVGGHIDGAYNVGTFMLGLAAPLIVFPQTGWRIAGPVLRLLGQRSALAATMLAVMAMIAAEGVRTATIINASDRPYYARNLGFHVSPQTAEDLQAMERLARHWDAQGIAPDKRLLSVYTSVLDVAARSQSPEPVGSLIHALGTTNRERFAAHIANRSVAAVTTIAPDYSGWAEWNLRANWPVFESLMAQYEPIARTDQHVLWMPSRGRGAIADAECEIAATAPNVLEIRVSAQVSGIASVLVERSAMPPARRSAILTVVEDSPYTRTAPEPAWSSFPRYGVANARVVAVPAPVEPGEDTLLTLEVLDGSPVGTARCNARVFAPHDLAALPSLADGIDAQIAEQRR